MRKLLSLSILFSLVISLLSCENGSPVEKIESIKTVSERVNDLKKTISEIKTFEDKDALSREEKLLLEYEYPIRENESYVVSYRFYNNVCIEINVSTYFNNEGDAQKVKKAILKDLKGNSTFSDPAFTNDIYKWISIDSTISMELNTQNIERGTIRLSILTINHPI